MFKLKCITKLKLSQDVGLDEIINNWQNGDKTYLLFEYDDSEIEDSEDNIIRLPLQDQCINN